jgi:protein involved in polysaccharide export with SLBB domain
MTSIHGVVVRRFVAVAIALSLALGLAPAWAADPPAPSDQTPINEIDWGQVPEYRIVPGDELAINFGPRENSEVDVVRVTIVRPDGRISVYPIGDMVAAGRTPAELQAELIRLLAAELKQPRVVVEVTKLAGNQVHVLGRVKKPGSQAVTSLPTLLQALAEAGGFEDDAARGSVIVMHRVGLGSVSVARVRVDRLLRRGGDVPLSRFDIVYVPRSAIGNVDVFVDQFFTRLLPVQTSTLIGWELFNLDRVFQNTVTGIRSQ